MKNTGRGKHEVKLKTWGVENTGSDGKHGVWKTRGVENTGCGKHRVWKARGAENTGRGKQSLRSWWDAKAGERRRSRQIPSQANARNSRAVKTRVKFPPATFGMGFACRPLLALLMNELNKPIRERSI